MFARTYFRIRSVLMVMLMMSCTSALAQQTVQGETTEPAQRETTAAETSGELIDPFSLVGEQENAKAREPIGQGSSSTQEPTRTDSTDHQQALSKPAAASDPAAIKAEVNTLKEFDQPAAQPRDLAAKAPPKNDREPQPEDVVLNGKYKRAYVIDLRGDIFGLMRWYLENRLARAKNSGVDLVVLRIKSPGGSLEHSIAMAQAVRGVDWATTIAFVSEEAISGAAIISLGCDRIYMQPRALIGDAGPVRMDPNGQFQHAEEKILSYLASAVRELATSQKRPPAIAEAMVDRTLKVFEATHKKTGAKTFLSEGELQQPENQEAYDRGNDIAEAGHDRFLTVNGQRALELQLAEGTFESEQELFKNLKFDVLEQTDMRWIDRLVYALNRPWLTGLLLVVGLIGLYLEFSVPGMSVAGMVSLISFGIFFWSHALGGTSGWLEVILFALGVICLGTELFVFPGFGIFGLTGLLLMGLSLVMASQDFVVPNSDIQWNELQRNLLIVGGSIAGVTGLLLVQLLYFDSLPGLNILKLNAPDEDSSAAAAQSLATSSASADASLPAPGAIGIAESVLRPAGKARFETQLVDVLTEGDFVDPGTPIEIIRREGNRIIVRKATG